MDFNKIAEDYGWVVLLLTIFAFNMDKVARVISPIVNVFKNKAKMDANEQSHDQEIEEASVGAFIQNTAALSSSIMQRNQQLVDHILQRDTEQLCDIQKDVKELQRMMLADSGTKQLLTVEMSKTHDALVELKNEIHTTLEIMKSHGTAK